MLIYRYMKKIIHKKDLNKVATALLSKVAKTKNTKAKIIAMSGDLGAGKTTLTQEIAKELGIKSPVASPTFVIMKIYKIESPKSYLKQFKKLVHIDAYRLEGAKELLKIGWDNIYNDKDNLIIIEWPENVKECLDKNTNFVYLNHQDEETRLFEF